MRTYYWDPAIEGGVTGDLDSIIDPDPEKFRRESGFTTFRFVNGEYPEKTLNGYSNDPLPGYPSCIDPEDLRQRVLSIVPERQEELSKMYMEVFPDGGYDLDYYKFNPLDVSELIK